MRFRLPTPPRPAHGALPPELHWDAPPATVALLLSRREFLRAAAVVLAALAVPLVRIERAAAKARGRFFTKRERATLEALVDRIIPPEPGVPGAKELGAARYVENLLTALDGKKARLFAGGPFSNRNPFPDAAHGTPSRKRSRNDFKHFVQPTRLQALFWRGELFGTASVPELAALDVQFGGPKTGLRDLYRDALARIDTIAESATTSKKPFADLPTADQDAVLAMLGAPGAFPADPRRDGDTIFTIIVRHTIEGSFSVPEYGGNAKGAGWRLLGLEGDSQPLGYSIFSTTMNAYVPDSRPDHPMTKPNPDETGPDGLPAAKPLSADGQQVQASISSLGPALDRLLCGDTNA
jgi:gluconate 2-dehydrogenase subunit 3-like protein